MFAGRVAQLHVSWLGYVATTGLASIDYLLMDPSTAPAGAGALVQRGASEIAARTALLRGPRLCADPGPAAIAEGRAFYVRQLQ